MKTAGRLFSAWIVGIACLASLSALGASGTWTNRNGGSWTNALNWNGGVIAGGPGSSANFSTLSLPGDLSITLDAPRTLGNLTFDDQNATKHNWLLSGTDPLTMAGTPPTITVLSGTTTISASLLGTAGVAKSGTGRLALTRTNSYTGNTVVNSGTLGVLTDWALSASSTLSVSPGAMTEFSGTLNLQVNTSSTALDVTGSGLLRLTGTNHSVANPDIYFGPNHSANTCWGARISTPLDLGSDQRFIFGKTGHNGVGPYGLSSTDCQFAGSIVGTGGLTVIGQNNWTGADSMEVPFALNASNSFTGPLEIQRGSVYLGNANALTRANRLTFVPAAGNNARLFLYGNNAIVSDLSSPGTGSPLIANGNLKSGATVTLGAATLTVLQNNDTSFNGLIADVYTEYAGSGTGTTGPLNLTKTGSGLLRLTGNSTYSGATVVSNGSLQIDGALGATAVTVNNAATLSGRGAIDGSVVVQSGGTIAPGDTGIGTLTINNSLALAGSARLKLNKTGTALDNDRVAGLSSVSYGGALLVTNIGDVRTGALANGESFNLFLAAAYTGSFATTSLPPLSAGLTWDTSNLNLDGSITVIGETAPPVITRHPQNLTVVEGNVASLSVIAAGVGPLSYQWIKNQSVVVGATAATFSLSDVSTNASGGYSVQVSNAFGSVTSLVATLTVFPAGTATPVTNGLVVYLNFDNNINAQAGTSRNASLYPGGATHPPRYRPGVIGSAVNFANTATAGQPDDWALTLGNLESTYSGDFSISLWERSATTGDGALMGNKDWTSGANVGWVISTLEPKNLNYNAVGGTRRDIGLNPPFSDANWHLATFTFNRTANQVISYLDGAPVSTSDISPSGSASFNAGYDTLIGGSGNGTYSGSADIDDLGVWNRVLTPEEISGIYGAGISGRPLPLAVPGQAPVIVEQPDSVNLSEGLTATLSVNASGQGTLFYQWRFNGTNIVGATNATLVLGSVSAANQGLYTVLVSNGSGAVLSHGAFVTIYQLAVTGQWDFDYADLRATVGAELEYRADTASLTRFPMADFNGQLVRVLAFGSNSPAQGFYMRHGAKPNGGGHFVNQYTLLMDIVFPAESTGQKRALLQTDPFNHDSNDAEFYVGGSSAAPDANGIGAEGEFHGTLSSGTWHRIAFAVNLAAPAGQELTTYINGLKVGTQSLPGGIDGRYSLGPAAVLFASGVAGNTQPGLVKSIQFVNGWMSTGAIAALGGPNASGLPAGNAALRIASISRNASLLTLTWTGPDGYFDLQKTSNLTNPAWQNIASFTNERTVSIPVDINNAFYRVNRRQADVQVGQLPNGEQLIPSKQVLRVSGSSVQFGGRPVDLALSPDGSKVFIKNMNNLLVLDAASWRTLQTLNYPGSGASMHGIATRSDGARIWITGAGNELYEWTVTTNGTVSFGRTISLPAESFPCGLAISPDATKAYICLSTKNLLAEVDLQTGAVTRQIPVGIAPWDVVLSADGSTAYVSDWGGRFPVAGDLTAASAGTQVVIDQRGAGASGTVSFVNLATGQKTGEVDVGLHASDLELSSDGATLFVANANSDTVSVIDTQTRTVKETILVRPDPAFPYGSAADALCLSKDGGSLFVAGAGNNAVAVIELPNPQHTNSVLKGFLPTDWYPGALTSDSNSLYVVNVKGLGSRQGQPVTTTWQIGAFLGTANKIAIPSSESLSKFTAQAFEDGRIREIRQAHQEPQPGTPERPLPVRPGEPSVFKHVLYILKENKTYDQMFGDLPQGNGEPSLCIYPRFVSPNHHALAEQYVLLDNYYCNGVNSADGHSWSTEANNTDHLEKAFGGFSRSYTFGDDALTYSSSGFIWNNVLEHGLSFRNYGEMDYASTSPAANWFTVYSDFTNGTHSINFVQNIGIASLRPYSSTNVPGWNLEIPDVLRADGFIRELNQAQARGSWETFHLLYISNDHTGGSPSPRAQVADNDLALGQVVEAVTKSIFGSNTVIFVIEDDPQSGYDHVDAHRSICLVISPYTRRHAVVSTFFNQAGVLHTMERILGLRPMNQQDAMAPLMFDCFTNTTDLTPYTALANNVPLAEGAVAKRTAHSPQDQYWAKKLKKMDFSRPDRINDDLFNRYIWYTVKGDAPYPAKYVGGHGKGLKQLGLVLDRSAKGDADD